MGSHDCTNPHVWTHPVSAGGNLSSLTHLLLSGCLCSVCCHLLVVEPSLGAVFGSHISASVRMTGANVFNQDSSLVKRKHVIVRG